MALVVNTNMASLVAQNHLAAGRRDMETAMERLSSGLRINGAADDAAGVAVLHKRGDFPLSCHNAGVLLGLSCVATERGCALLRQLLRG